MKKIIYSLVLVLIASFSFAETIIINPTDDMYTDAENQGATPVNTQLWTANFTATGQFQRIMLKFDLAPYENRQLESAVLNLTRFYSCPSGGTTATTFYAISQDWDENTWPFNQSISYNSEHNKPYVFSGNGGNAIVHFNVDITDFIEDYLNGFIENYGFLIMANNNQKFSKFFSKEHTVEEYRPTLTLTFGETSNSDEVAVSKEIIANNYPNPFNPSTTINYSIQNSSQIDINIYNIKGQLVNNIFTGHQNAGQHSIVWDGNDSKGKITSAGVYYYKISTPSQTILKPMVMVK